MKQTELPHSEECERAVLSCILLSPQLTPRLLEALNEEMFYSERHRAIFSALKKLHQNESRIDLRTLQAQLEEQRQFDLVGGVAYLAGMDLDLPDLSNFDAYTDIIRDRWARRETIHQLRNATRDALNSDTETGPLLNSLQNSLLSIEQARARNSSFRSLSDALLDLDVYTPVPDGLLGLPSGLIDLDKITLGFQPGQLIIVAGRPSMGKTSLAVGMAAHQAKLGHHTGFSSLEDVESRLALKWLSQETKIPHQRLALGKTRLDERGTVTNAMQRLARAPLFIDDTAGQTVEQICASARELTLQHGLEILYVDYLHLLRSSSHHRESRNLELGHVTKQLKELAKGLHIPIILLSQLSRAVERRDNKRPILADLRDSGEIEQDADTVIMCHRPSWYNPDDSPGTAELLVVKNKTGPTHTVKTVFDPYTTSFSDYTNTPEPPAQGDWRYP